MDNYNDYVNDYMNSYECPVCNDTKIQSDKNARKINEIIEQVNTIIDFNINNIGSTEQIGPQIEPRIKDIPMVFFNGDITGMSKDNEKKIRIRYSSETLQFDEYCKIKWQGSSSIAYPKKNYTIKLFKNEECTSKSKKIFRNWVEANKFCLKANYVDSTHARNIVTAKLSRELYNEKLPVECQGTIDGFPIWVYINGVLQGLYTWNIPKDAKQMYGMNEDNPNHLMYVGNKNANKSTVDNWASQFRALATNTREDEDNGWEEAFPETYTTENLAKLNRLISFVKDSSDEVFKRDFNQYMDLDYAISYWIYAYVGCMADSLGKNLIIITYDGLKWYPVFYDLDGVWGMRWDGQITLPVNYKCPDDYQENRSLLWEKLVRNFPTEIYNKYLELRKNVLREDYIFEKFERFIDIIPKDKYTKDQSVWSSIPSKSYDLDQIRSYVLERMKYCDIMFSKLIGNDVEEPDEPDKPVKPDEPTEPSLVVWVNSDDLTSSSTVWNDKTNNNYNFNITDGTPNITDDGLDMRSCKVQGANENISLNGVFTYNVKFKFEATYAHYSCFVSFNQNNVSKYCDSIKSDKLIVNGYSGDKTTTLNISSNDLTTIHNLTIVYNNNNIRVYYNGEFHSEYPKGTSNLNGNFKLVLGASSWNDFPIEYSKFRIKEFKLYNTVLSDDQIRTL